MELLDILKRIFPAGVVRERGGDFEINGLPRGTQPESCEVLARGIQPVAKGERREHFLVRADNALLFFRICSAMPGAGYDEFVANRGVAFAGDEQQRLERYARESIAYLCKPQ